MIATVGKPELRDFSENFLCRIDRTAKIGYNRSRLIEAYDRVAQGIEHSPPKREVERFPKTAFQAHTSEYAPIAQMDGAVAS